MNQRQRTASLVSTFAQQDTSRVRHATQRQQQVRNALGKLGVNLQQERRAEAIEQGEALRAESNENMRVLTAQHAPKIQEALARPETYNQSVEEFLQSDVYKEGASAIQNGITTPDHREEFLENYKASMLDAFSKGQVRQQAIDKERKSTLAIQASAELGVVEHLKAHDDAVASGTSHEDAFAATFATAVLKGPKYLQELQKARDWTPEEDAQFARHIAGTKKTFNMQAAVALKLAKKEQDRTERANALNNVIRQYSESLSNDQKATVVADLHILGEEIRSEHFVRSNLGTISTSDLAQGIGFEGRKLPIADIKRIQNEEFTAAIQAGDQGLFRVTQLLAIPGDEPDAAKQYFSGIVGSLTQAKEEDLGKVQQALKQAQFLENVLNPDRLESLLGAEDHANYQEFRASVEFDGLEKAVADNELISNLKANGKLPTPERWANTERKAVDYALTSLKPKFYEVFTPSVDSMTRGAVSSQLAPMLRQWKAKGLNLDKIKKRIDKLGESSWNGYLRGGVLGDTLKTLTNGNNGNPYKGKTEVDLWNEYKDFKLEELRKENPHLEGLQFVIGRRPDEVFIVDESGLQVPNSRTTADEIKQTIVDNVKTTKQELEDESRTTTQSPTFRNSLNSL